MFWHKLNTTIALTWVQRKRMLTLIQACVQATRHLANAGVRMLMCLAHTSLPPLPCLPTWPALSHQDHPDCDKGTWQTNQKTAWSSLLKPTMWNARTSTEKTDYNATKLFYDMIGFRFLSQVASKERISQCKSSKHWGTIYWLKEYMRMHNIHLVCILRKKDKNIS
jgi:hypothetical protein